MSFPPQLLPPPWIAAACLALLATSAAGQSNTTVDASLISERIPLGEQSALVIRVINGKPETLPDSIPVEGLTIARSNRMEQKHSFGTDGNRSEYQFYYYLSGSRAGVFTIPSITVRVNGADYQTAPKTLTVYERDPNDPALDASRPYFANLTTPAAEVYAGQMAPFDLDVYVRGARSINDMGPPMMRHESIVTAFERNFDLDIVELDGIPFTIARRPGSFFGLTPGTYTLGPAEVQVAMIDESSPLPGFFQSVTAKTLQSNPLEVVVKPLPESGRPPQFRGAVGSFNVSLKASPLKLTVGDPISLEFVVSGPGNYETVQSPALDSANLADWRTYDARKIIDPNDVSDGVTPGRASFSQIVMPQTQVTEIPPFELAFFNPETGSYETRRTDPIPIQVAPDTRAASGAAGVAIPAAGQDAAAANGGNVPYQPEAAPTPAPAYNDIVHIRTMDPVWRPAPATVTGKPIFWIGQIIPSITFLTLLGFGIARRVNRKAKSRESRKFLTYRAARASVDSAPSRADYYRAILTALDSWEREAGPGAERRLPDSLAAAIPALRARAQWLIYGSGGDDGPGSPPDPADKNECARILDALGQQLD